MVPYPIGPYRGPYSPIFFVPSLKNPYRGHIPYPIGPYSPYRAPYFTAVHPNSSLDVVRIVERKISSRWRGFYPYNKGPMDWPSSPMANLDNNILYIFHICDTFVICQSRNTVSENTCYPFIFPIFRSIGQLVLGCLSQNWATFLVVLVAKLGVSEIK